MPEDYPKPETAPKAPETKDQPAKAPEGQPATPETKPEDQVGATLRACEDQGKKVCQNPEEKDQYTTTVEVTTLPPHLQQLAISVLTHGADDGSLRILQEYAAVRVEGQESAPLPDSFEVEAYHLELTFDSKYFSYESAEDGTRTLKITIPGTGATVDIAGAQTPEGDIAAGAGVTLEDEAHKLRVGAGVNPALGEGHVGGTVTYTGKESGTSVAVAAGADQEGTPGVSLTVSQKTPQDTVLTGTLVLAQGTVTGTLDYSGSLGNITLTIGDSGLVFNGTFQAELAPGVSVYATGTVQAPTDGATQVEGTAGVKADMGHGGTISAEGYVGRPTDDDKKDAGFMVTYEIPL